MKRTILLILFSVYVLGSNSQTISDKELKKQIGDLLNSYSFYNRFSGNVLVTRNNNVIFEKSYGFADIETKKKNTKGSIFDICSVSKSLTAVGVMKLVEQGKITLETPVSTFFPEFIPDYSGKITVRHLLNHSSGMEANIARKDESGNGLVMPDENLFTLEDIFEKFKGTKLKFEPGKSFEYNNLGYLLLAHIIEIVSKQTYANYMTNEVFEPANMKSSEFAAFKYINKCSYPHVNIGAINVIKHQDNYHQSWIMGAGGIKSTTNDLCKFMNALENGTILKPATVEMLFSLTQSLDFNNEKYGLGWEIGEKAGEKYIRHNGGYYGYASVMGFLPNRNIKIIILSNLSSSFSDEEYKGKHSFIGELNNKIIDAIQGKTIECLPLPINKSSNIYLSSKYDVDDKHSIKLSAYENDLWLETTGSEPWSVFTYSFSNEQREDSKAYQIALKFAKAMKTQNLDSLVNYADDEMKDFLGTEAGLGQLKGSWNYFLSQNGEFKSCNIYKITGKKVKNIYIRFHFEKSDVGIALSFNSNNLIQGLFLDSDVKTCNIKKVKLIPIGDNEFFINGYHYKGMQDIKISLRDDKLILTDGDVVFSAVKAL
ncbi:MAG: serine hydrolase [Bacteroidales bacterium]|nr:serine hydrolase [Bacteroidales bacterium]